jgi:hypothetical protein
VGSTGCRFKESGINIREVVDLEDLAGWVSTVFREAAVYLQLTLLIIPITMILPTRCDTVSLKVLAKQEFTAATIEAFSAKFGITRADFNSCIRKGVGGTNSATTRSPTVNPLTAGPMAATTPTISCPVNYQGLRDIYLSKRVVVAPNETGHLTEPPVN